MDFETQKTPKTPESLPFEVERFVVTRAKTRNATRRVVVTFCENDEEDDEAFTAQRYVTVRSYML